MCAWNINQIMALSINTNIASITTQRHLNKSRAELNTAMERLSSGKRINSAKDDAAGLAISQKMTAQIEGLRQAVRNSNDAISLAQTAEGAMEEITNMLQRIRTLSVQAINDTNSSTDRQALNNEVVELKAEINRIANTTVFNNKPLLKDGYSGTFQIGHQAGQTITLELNDASTTTLGAVSTTGYSTHASTPPSAVIVTPAAAGDGVIDTHIISTTAEGARSVTTADVDGDGDLDVLSASQDDDRIVWYENDGNQSFTEHTISTTANYAQSVTTADVDGDGDLDVLSASQHDRAITWYENDGNQSFTKHVIYSGVNNLPYSVTTADVDGDGDLDVLSAEASHLAWYENNGSQSFTEHTITSDDYATSITSADVDGDGDLDIVSVSYDDDKIAWFENNGSQSFTEHNISMATTRPFSITTTDVDGDGDIDVLSASITDGKIVWYENNGSQSFTEHTISTTASAQSVIAVDVDGDRDMDVLSASWGDDKISWYENDGSENFTTHTISTTVDGASSVATADINGDGHLDVLSASQNDDKIAWYDLNLTYTGLSTLDFNSLNLVEGDRITLTIAGGTQVQGTIGSTGLDALLTSMATDVASQTGLFSAASTSNGVLTLTGLTDGSAMADVTVTLESYATTTAIADISLLTSDNATSALTTIDQAIQNVSSQRSVLGAFQNRLEHAVSNLSNMSVNTESARSKILDTDYAVEASRLAKNQILQQVGIAMLAQANATKDLVISLLRNLTH